MGDAPENDTFLSALGCLDCAHQANQTVARVADQISAPNRFKLDGLHMDVLCHTTATVPWIPTLPFKPAGMRTVWTWDAWGSSQLLGTARSRLLHTLNLRTAGAGSPRGCSLMSLDMNFLRRAKTNTPQNIHGATFNDPPNT